MDIMTALFDQEEVTRRFHLRLRNEGINEGETKGKAEDVITVMKKLKCTQDKAMDFLDIPQNERKEVIKYLNNSNT